MPGQPFYNIGSGLMTPLATILPPGAEIRAYVSSNTTRANDYPSDVRAMLRSTLNAGLALCRSGYGDVVVVLPGHTENVASADQMTSLVAGTQIVGLGFGTNRPTFTWSTATSTFLLDVANVKIYNCMFNMAGSQALTAALSVAAPMTVSAAGCGLYGCEANVGFDADQLATIAITTTAAGDDFELRDCYLWGNAGSAVTTVVRMVGADRCRMYNTYIIAETSANGVGVVQHITTASTLIFADSCTFVNLKAAGTAAYTGLAASSGVLTNCAFGYYGDSGLSAITTAGDIQVFKSQTCNDQGETGAVSTTASVA